MSDSLAMVLSASSATDLEVVANKPSAEAELVLRARRGESRAWTALYDRYAKTVHACVLARVPAADAEDLVQDAFASAFRRLDSLADVERFGGWLMTIARNRAVDYWRRARPTDELSGEEVGSSRPHLEANEVLRAIRRLPESYRETLVMRLVEGMTGPEIAERTGLTHGSVRVNLSRGMKLLRNDLEVEP